MRPEVHVDRDGTRHTWNDLAGTYDVTNPDGSPLGLPAFGVVRNEEPDRWIEYHAALVRQGRVEEAADVAPWADEARQLEAAWELPDYEPAAAPRGRLRGWLGERQDRAAARTLRQLGLLDD